MVNIFSKNIKKQKRAKKKKQTKPTIFKNISKKIKTKKRNNEPFKQISNTFKLK